MNKLYGSRVYLAGPMDRVKDGGVEWRNNLTPLLNDLGIIVLDPCNKPTDLAKEGNGHRETRQKLLNTNDFDEITAQIKEIRRVDLRMVDVSDFLIVNWDMNIHMCGTLEEVFLANRQKKPILIVVEGGIKNLPDWMFGVLPYQHFFNDWDELKEYVRHVHEDKNVKHYKRWFFLNYDKL